MSVIGTHPVNNTIAVSTKYLFLCAMATATVLPSTADIHVNMESCLMGFNDSDNRSRK